MKMFNYSDLENFVKAEDYEQAEAFCLNALEEKVESVFWKTQLGYVYFLNEKNIEASYEYAPSIFKSLVTQNPTDVNAHFWLGYIYTIVLHDEEHFNREIQEALRLDSNHPYANLVLASHCNSQESEKILKKVLERQPTNFRAILQLADALVENKQIKMAKELLKKMLVSEAYVEQEYGIMNEYINGVLTCATIQKELCNEAEIKLNKI